MAHTYLIPLEEVLEYHADLVAIEGNATGVRDIDGLMSALSRPLASFGGEDLFPTIFGKAAALLEAIVVNHPFLDGNKRTGWIMTKVFLKQNHWVPVGSDDECEAFVLSIASGEKDTQSIADWLEAHCEPYKYKS